MEPKKSHASRGLRTAALFIALAFVLQLIFVMFLTPQGLYHVYPYVVRLKSERVRSDASFAEYYDLRTAFADGEMFLLGTDMGIAESYFVILDYIRFLKKSFDIETVALPVTPYVAEIINEYISAQAGDDLESAEEKLYQTGVRSNEYYDFIKNLRSYNETLSPQRKLNIAGIYTETIENDIINDFVNKVISNWTDAGEVLSRAISISKADEFFDYFDGHTAEFERFLSEAEFSRYSEARNLYREGVYDDWKAYDKISTLGDGKVLCVLSNERIAPRSKLYGYLDSCGKTYYAVQTKYSGCESAVANGKKVEVNDIDLPFSSEMSVRFVSGGETASFLDFYRYVANPSSSPEKEETASALDRFATQNYFIVSDSPAVSYDTGGGTSDD